MVDVTLNNFFNRIAILYNRKFSENLEAFGKLEYFNFFT